MLRLAAALMACLISPDDAPRRVEHGLLVQLPARVETGSGDADRIDAGISVCAGFAELSQEREIARARVRQLARDADIGVCRDYAEPPIKRPPTPKPLDYLEFRGPFDRDWLFRAYRRHHDDFERPYVPDIEKILRRDGVSWERSTLWAVVFTEEIPPRHRGASHLEGWRSRPFIESAHRQR